MIVCDFHLRLTSEKASETCLGFYATTTIKNVVFKTSTQGSPTTNPTWTGYQNLWVIPFSSKIVLGVYCAQIAQNQLLGTVTFNLPSSLSTQETFLTETLSNTFTLHIGVKLVPQAKRIKESRNRKSRIGIILDDTVSSGSFGDFSESQSETSCCQNEMPIHQTLMTLLNSETTPGDALTIGTYFRSSLQMTDLPPIPTDQFLDQLFLSTINTFGISSKDPLVGGMTKINKWMVVCQHGLDSRNRELKQDTVDFWVDGLLHQPEQRFLDEFYALLQAQAVGQNEWILEFCEKGLDALLELLIQVIGGELDSQSSLFVTTITKCFTLIMKDADGINYCLGNGNIFNMLMISLFLPEVHLSAKASLLRSFTLVGLLPEGNRKLFMSLDYLKETFSLADNIFFLLELMDTQNELATLGFRSLCLCFINALCTTSVLNIRLELRELLDSYQFGWMISEILAEADPLSPDLVGLQFQYELYQYCGFMDKREKISRDRLSPFANTRNPYHLANELLALGGQYNLMPVMMEIVENLGKIVSMNRLPVVLSFLGELSRLQYGRGFNRFFKTSLMRENLVSSLFKNKELRQQESLLKTMRDQLQQQNSVLRTLPFDICAEQNVERTFLESLEQKDPSQKSSLTSSKPGECFLESVDDLLAEHSKELQQLRPQKNNINNNRAKRKSGSMKEFTRNTQTAKRSPKGSTNAKKVLMFATEEQALREEDDRESDYLDEMESIIKTRRQSRMADSWPNLMASRTRSHDSSTIESNEDDSSERSEVSSLNTSRVESSIILPPQGMHYLRTQRKVKTYSANVGMNEMLAEVNDIMDGIDAAFEANRAKKILAASSANCSPSASTEGQFNREGIPVINISEIQKTLSGGPISPHKKGKKSRRKTPKKKDIYRPSFEEVCGLKKKVADELRSFDSKVVNSVSLPITTVLLTAKRVEPSVNTDPDGKSPLNSQRKSPRRYSGGADTERDKKTKISVTARKETKRERDLNFKFPQYFPGAPPSQQLSSRTKHYSPKRSFNEMQSPQQFPDVDFAPLTTPQIQNTCFQSTFVKHRIQIDMTDLRINFQKHRSLVIRRPTSAADTSGTPPTESTPRPCISLLHPLSSSLLMAFLKSKRNDYKSLANAILHIDVDILSSSVLPLFLSWKMSNNELLEIKLHKSKSNIDTPPVDLPSNFAIELASIPFRDVRFKTIKFIHHFLQRTTKIKLGIQAINRAIKCLKNTQNFRIIFIYILEIGLKLSGDHYWLSRARGFRLSSLPLLQKMQGTDLSLGHISLMDFVVDIIQSQDPDCLDFEKCSDLNITSAVCLNQLEGEVNKLFKTFEKLKVLLVLSTTEDKILAALFNPEGQLSSVKPSLKQLRSQISSLQHSFHTLVTSYGEDPQHTTVSEFFGHFTGLISSINISKASIEIQKKINTAHWKFLHPTHNRTLMALQNPGSSVDEYFRRFDSYLGTLVPKVKEDVPVSSRDKRTLKIHK